MADDLRRRPWMAWRHMATLAGLHDRLHRIRFERGRVIHLDLHPDNVLVSDKGPVVIDWTNARSGEPDHDVALTWLILRTSAGLPGRILARIFRSKVGADGVRRGLDEARAFRVADPHVSDAERARALRATP